MVIPEEAKIKVYKRYSKSSRPKNRWFVYCPLCGDHRMWFKSFVKAWFYVNSHIYTYHSKHRSRSFYGRNRTYITEDGSVYGYICEVCGYHKELPYGKPPFKETLIDYEIEHLDKSGCNNELLITLNLIERSRKVIKESIF